MAVLRCPGALHAAWRMRDNWAAMPENTNDELLQRALAGDQQALGELLRKQNSLLEQMARKDVQGRLQSRLSAADIVQQTCLSAVRSFEDFEGISEPQFVAWLRGIHDRNVRDIVRKHVHAKKRGIAAQQAFDDGTEPVQHEPTASDHAIRRESAAELLAAIGTLPETQAEAVRLRYLDQLSLKDIAARMSTTDVAVASLLKRGLAALRNRIPGNSQES